MSLKAMTWAWQLPLSSNQKLVLLALADHADDSGKCWPGLDGLSEKCGLSRSSLIEHLKKLSSLNIINKQKVYDENGKRRANIYVLNLSLSPESLRSNSAPSEALSPDLLRSKNTSTKSRSRTLLSPDSGRVYNKPSKSNRHEPSNTCPKVQKLDISDGSAKSPFVQFWTIYPKQGRAKKKRSAEIWKSKKLDSKLELILADVQKRTVEHGQWIKGYIPHASSYLNGEYWNDEIVRLSEMVKTESKALTVEEKNKQAMQELLRGAQ